MKKRILIAVVLVLAVVMLAQTGAWAGKLISGDEAPAPAALEAGARPAGTGGSDYVPTGPNSGAPYVPPAAAGVVWGLDDFTGEVPEGAPEGATFKEGTESGSGDTMTEAHVFAVEGASAVWYWNGSEWVELEITDGKATVPAGAPNPVLLAFVTE